eukprot:Skav219571  [mRNA]  locus=scaffold3203:34691:39556:- [translate_table: standard]
MVIEDRSTYVAGFLTKLDGAQGLRGEPAMESKETSQQATHNHCKREAKDHGKPGHDVHLFMGRAQHGACHGHDDKEAI